MNILPFEKQTQIIGALRGLSMRSVSRLFDVERNTIVAWRFAWAKVANAC